MGKLTSNSLLSSIAHSLSFSRSQSHAYTTRSCICSADSDLSLIRFEAGLAERLCSLRAGTTSANLNWIIDALAVANSTQTSLRSIVPQLTKSQNKAKLQQSLDSTVGLLDVCNALKDAMAEIQDYLARLQKALKPLSELAYYKSQSGTRESMQQVAAMRLQTCLTRLENGNRKRWQSRLEEACSSLKLLKTQMQRNGAAAHSISAVEGAALTTALVLGAAAWTPSRRTAKNIGCAVHCVNSPWAGPLRELQRQLLNQQDGTIWQEMDSLHVATSALHEFPSNCSKIDEMSWHATRAAAAEALLKKAGIMEASVAELRQKLGVLFQSVASVRLDTLAN